MALSGPATISNVFATRATGAVRRDRAHEETRGAVPPPQSRHSHVSVEGRVHSVNDEEPCLLRPRRLAAAAGPSSRISGTPSSAISGQRTPPQGFVPHGWTDYLGGLTFMRTTTYHNVRDRTAPEGLAHAVTLPNRVVSCLCPRPSTELGVRGHHGSLGRGGHAHHEYDGHPGAGELALGTLRLALKARTSAGGSA